MVITIESTSKKVTVNGVEARLWEGTTDSGIPVICFITRIAVELGADQEQFRRELRRCTPPSPGAASFADRLIL